ncbi:MAG: FecR family protein [Daejeonella sp.]|uniref:FecR family protein n=1 Tax=Daejeonella sp. JGW-45 TaxID=3034148 RepID=UPI0023ECEF61|nr:FecR family protein [Daejeonella sp. JGW-45]
MQKGDIEKLLAKYKAGTCTEEERSLLETWYLYYEDDQISELSDSERADDLRKIRTSLLFVKQKGKQKSYIPRIVAAAAILVIALAGTLFFMKNEPAPSVVVKTSSDNQDIDPGSNKAKLTLADGSVISLDDAHEGTLAKQTGIAVTKTTDGQLVYAVLEDAQDLSELPVSYNKIETPMGGQYRIDLPDGTKVWLNAASSLRYPTSFSGADRQVELTGEAYFEVAHNKEMPFKVTSREQTVEVLGTHFNISSYWDDQEVKTTLVEGSVRVANNKVKTVLKPGEQAVLSKDNQFITVSEANTETAIAWKNGYFHFNRNNIQDIMKELARWYDIEVVYEGEIPADEFVGKIRRSVTLLQSLKMLKLSNIHFRIEGRKIIITG